MPSRKQRRRREKEKRHEYEYVYVDESGNEVEPEPGDGPQPAREPRAKASTNGKPAKPAKTPATAKDARGRTLRPVRPPSWRRAAQRALLFVAVLFLFISLVGKHKPSLPARIGLAAVYGAAAIPLFYWMDRMAFRRFERLSSGGGVPTGRREPTRKR